jgi:Flp pilus assembly protein CpaB
MAVVAPETRSTPRADRQPPPARPVRQRRSLSERLTLNLVVGVVAGLLAFVLVASLLADRRERTSVAVAGAQIAAGTVITPGLLVSESVPSDTGFISDLVPMERISSGELVATRTIQPGEPLLASAVGDQGSVTPARAMSIPLVAWQAANGEIEVGDQVDVIVSTRDEGSRYVLTAAPVVDRSSDADASGGLVGGTRRTDLVITVEVDADEALELAAAIEDGTLTVVRSTGVTARASAASEGGG